MKETNGISGILATVLTIAGLIIGCLGGALVYSDDDKIADLETQIADLKDAGVVEIIEIVENEVIVESENLNIVLDYIYDNNGKIKYVINDLDGDEVNQIVDRIIFESEIKINAAEAVKNVDIDDLEDSDLNIYYLDEDDIENVDVQDDAEDITVSNVDYDDSDAIVSVTVEFEQDHFDYIAVYDVEIRDGEVDDIELVSIDLE